MSEDLVEDCRYCGDPVDIEEDRSFKSVSDRFAHAECMAEYCYEDRELVATTEGTFEIKPVSVIERVGGQEKVIDAYWRADCPMCWQTHETDNQDEDVRWDLCEQVFDCCEPVEWLPPEDYIEDCDVCGDDHRESNGCTPLSRREPFPSPKRHQYECTECDWAGSDPEDFDNRDGYCPECGSAAVRAVSVATDGGTDVDGTERETVWVTGRQAGGGPERAIHIRRDCPIVESANTVFKKDRSVYPEDKPVCNTCSGEIDQPETQDHSHLKSLKTAAGADGE